MKRVLNPELDRIILDALATRYKLREKRVGIHLSTLNYCLTKGYLDLRHPIEPTDTELLNFATGYGLQETMFPATDDNIFIKDEVIYRPDGILPLKIQDVEQLVEIKSTRAGVKRYQEGDLPETWVTYMKGGCCIRGTQSYNLSVIYLAERPSAMIISETVYFDADEIEANWQWVLKRRDLYKEALETETVPLPFVTAPKWMCSNCRYRTICDAKKMMEVRRVAEKDIKELW